MTQPNVSNEPAQQQTNASSHDPVAILSDRFRQAFISAFGDEFANADPIIKATNNPKFGDFQANAAMGLAKRLGQKPRDIAQTIIEHVNLSDICETPLEIAGPGFINLRLRSDALAQLLLEIDTENLGIAPLAKGHRVVVDMVSVNVAKQMHVGHLRSAIIGDAICRITNRLGYEVIPQNHLGDWGLQIAMVLTNLRQHNVNLDTLTLEELENAYRSANLECKADRKALESAHKYNAGPHRIAAWEEQVAGAEEAVNLAKATLVNLQAKEADLVADWQKLIRITLDDCYSICELLGLQLNKEHEYGESAYRDMLPVVINDFIQSGLAVESDGALIVRIKDQETPLLIRKSDGGFLYATTDLAGVRYRTQTLGAERIIYVVDARQRDHFKKVFEAVRMIGWDQIDPDNDDATNAQLVHLSFGAVCDTNGIPLKTRSGENIRLRSLLEEAIRRAADIVREKNPDLSEEEQITVARAVGIGAVKYADLQTHVGKDYIFDWNRMLAFEGNTGAYLQNQYVRIRSIGRKAPGDICRDAPFAVCDPKEKMLALQILRYPSVLQRVGESMEPHRLCQYLYDLANAFSGFYTVCPILKAETTEQRDGRFRLALLTERILDDGLSLLGIQTIERM